MAWDDISSKKTRRRFRNELSLWIVLTGLAIAGLRNGLVVLGLLFFAPGVVLMLAPNLLLYAAPLRVAVWLGWRWPSILGAIAVLGIGASLVLGPPMTVNARLDADARRFQAQDFDNIPSSSPAPRTIAFGEDCFEDCKLLLGQGLADRIVTPLTQRDGLEPSKLEAVFRLAGAEACRAAGMAMEAAARGCILRGLEMDPKVDAVVKTEYQRDKYRGVETREQLLDPMELGRQTVQRLELWICFQSCSLAVRRTYVLQERLFAPLVLYADQNRFGFGTERAWMRLPWGGQADPVAFVASKWPAKASSLNAAEVQDLTIVYDVDAAARIATPGLDDAGLRWVLRSIENGSGPLSASEKTLLRRLFDKPSPQGIPNDNLNKRPEVVEAVKDQLGPLLMALAARRSKNAKGTIRSFDDPEAEMRVNTQRLIADLSEVDYRKLRPTLLSWLKSGAQKEGPNDERFLARLKDLGAVAETRAIAPVN